MPVEIGLWRVSDGAPKRVTTSGVPLEAQLEDFIEADPALLGEPIMLIGRQVPTGFGTYIDLLGVDPEGGLHVLELKRERTPREVVAQVLDYGSWVAGLSHDDVLGLFETYRAGVPFEQAFVEQLGTDPPDEINTAQTLTVIASDVDPATERIVRYLNGGFDVPVNVVFFRYFQDGDNEYLARTWLMDDDSPSTKGARSAKKRGGKEPWNGQDWYVSFGEFADGRLWEDGRKYGFVSAGGGLWFSRTLRSLPLGARVFVCIPKTGYVGVGTVLAEAQRFDEAVVEYMGAQRRLTELPLSGSYVHSPGGDNEETAEYVVPVAWTSTRSRDEAFWKTGMFANQNSACKLRNKFTLAEVAREFKLDGEPTE